MAPDKDINVHVRARDTEEFQRKLDDSTGSVYDFYKAMGDASNQAGEQTEKTTQKFSIMDTIIGRAKTAALGFVSAWVGMQGVSKYFDATNERLQKMLDLSKEFFDMLTNIQKVGQALAFQTNTPGQQTTWGMKALDIQKAGGLGDITSAQALMMGMQKVYGGQGGIQNANIYNVLKGIAPAVGAAGMGTEEINALFQIAERAKVAPGGLMDMMAKIRAGAAAGKMTFGEFLSNAGSGIGFTNYLAGGGSLDKAISLYAAAGNVSANKRTGNSLLDMITDISAGQNEEARKTVERASGQSFQNMNIDQRADAVLNYINSLPEAMRVQILAKHGFAQAADIAKLATPQARQIIESTQGVIAGTTAGNILPTVNAYTQSMAFQEQQTKTETEKQKVSMSPGEQAWQHRLTAAKGQYELLAQKGQAPLFTRENVEEMILAYQQMEEESQKLIDTSPPGSLQRRQAIELNTGIWLTLQNIKPIPFPGTVKNLYQGGIENAGRLKQLQEPNSVIIHNDNSINYHPTVGVTENQRDPNL